jgi:hypothetical protein
VVVAVSTRTTPDVSVRQDHRGTQDPRKADVMEYVNSVLILIGIAMSWNAIRQSRRVANIIASKYVYGGEHGVRSTDH